MLQSSWLVYSDRYTSHTQNHVIKIFININKNIYWTTNYTQNQQLLDILVN